MSNFFEGCLARRIAITWPGPLSLECLQDAYAAGYALERWTPECAVFVRGDWSETVLKPALEAANA